jgi:pimeloyl-ACP methyl ester carboxylesterase
MLLLHAAGSTPRALDRLAGLLAKPGWTVQVPDLSLRERSLAADVPEPLAEARALVACLLEPDGVGSRVVFGHSMGGLVALLALLGGARVDAAVLYEPIVLSLLDPADPVDREALAWDAAVVADFRKAMGAGDAEAGVRRFVEAYGGVPWQSLPGAARGDLVLRAAGLLGQVVATNGARLEPEAVRRVASPVLIIEGARSPAVTRRMVRRLAGLLPGAKQVTLEGAGHMGPVGSPQAVAAVVTAFLAGRLAPPPC